MLNHRLRPLLLALCAPLLFALVGCSYVETHRYDDAKLDLMSQGSGKVAIATQDLRPEVLEGDFMPDTTGVVRAFFGNASFVTTASRRSLAEDITNSVAEGLRSRGYEPVIILAAPTDDPRTIRDKVDATEAPHTIRIEVRKWNSSTWQRTAVKYDLRVDLESKSNLAKASASLDGRKSLGGSFLHPFVFARQAVPRFYKEQIEILLNGDQPRSVLSN